jgi:hypothetical protein
MRAAGSTERSKGPRGSEHYQQAESELDTIVMPQIYSPLCRSNGVISRHNTHNNTHIDTHNAVDNLGVAN